MHAFELQIHISKLFAELESTRPFTEALSALAQSAKVMESNLTGIAIGSDQMHQAANQIHVHLSQVSQTTSAINQRQFFRALEHFQRGIAQLLPYTPKNQLIANLDANIEQFSAVYDEFISKQSGRKALPLVMAARSLETQIGVFFDSLQILDELIGAYDIPGSTEGSLAILLPSHLSLTSFANRLLALQSMYTELCMLLSVSESDYPLRISKIESGSLWAKVFGESRIVAMIASFLEQTASWMYRTYTTEGKLASIPRKVEAIDAVLSLTQRLNDAGFDTSQMKEHIEKSAVALSKSLDTILDGQPSLTVNDQTISLASELTKHHLGLTSHLQLPNSARTINGDTAALPPPK